jgi:hypothetical protein
MRKLKDESSKQDVNQMIELKGNIMPAATP